jgi:hypothetical protein
VFQVSEAFHAPREFGSRGSGSPGGLQNLVGGAEHFRQILHPQGKLLQVQKPPASRQEPVQKNLSGSDRIAALMVSYSS